MGKVEGGAGSGGWAGLVGKWGEWRVGGRGVGESFWAACDPPRLPNPPRPPTRHTPRTADPLGHHCPQVRRKVEQRPWQGLHHRQAGIKVVGRNPGVGAVGAGRGRPGRPRQPGRAVLLHHLLVQHGDDDLASAKDDGAGPAGGGWGGVEGRGRVQPHDEGGVVWCRVRVALTLTDHPHTPHAPNNPHGPGL